MARAITGLEHPPRYTTGPATRRALAAAGALGATTGSVVHLAGSPAAGRAVDVLAHELAHAGRPVVRPRFLLAGASTAGDDEERAALAVGRRAGTESSVGAGLVDQLPVGGGLGAVGDVATRAAREAVIEAAAATRLLAPGPSAVGDVPVVAGSGPLPTAATAAAGGPTSVEGAVAASGPSAAAATGSVGATGAAGSSPAAQPWDADRVVEVVEERLLQEIERRGGRWAGVF